MRQLLDPTLIQDLTAAFGVIAALAACAAAFIGLKALEASRDANTTAQRTYSVAAAATRPRIALEFRGGAIGNKATGLPVQIRNAGGGALPFHAIIHVGRTLYLIRKAVPQGASLTEKADWLGDCPQRSEVPVIVVTLAKDNAGGWWDMKAGQPVHGDVNSWNDQECRRYGLPRAPAQPEVTAPAKGVTNPPPS